MIKGHTVTLIKKQCRLDMSKVSFHKEQFMNGIDYQVIVYVQVMLICLK